MRLTWLVLAAGAVAGVWLAGERGMLAWLVLSAAAVHAVGVLTYCWWLSGRRDRVSTVYGTVYGTANGTVGHCRPTVGHTVGHTAPPTVAALSDSGQRPVARVVGDSRQ